MKNKCLSEQYLNLEELKDLKYFKSVFYVPEKMDWICEVKSPSAKYDYDKVILVLKPSTTQK